MVVNSESRNGNTIVKLWLLLHRVCDVIRLCEDLIFYKYGLTMEQFSVLYAIKSCGNSLRPAKLALLLERSPNSISMLVDRMVKAGLVKRTRERMDRRAVRVSLTSKGKNAIEQASPVGWEFIQQMLSVLSYKEKEDLATRLELVKCKAIEYLNPEVDMAEIIANSSTNQPDLYERLVRNVFPSDYKVKLHGEKTVAQ